MPLAQGRNYGVFSGNIPMQSGDFFLECAADSITATAGGVQSNAYQITTQTTRVTTVATAADSVQLPPSAPGLELLVINHGANPMQVYGNYVEAATIDDQATATGVSQMANSLVIYTCTTAGSWYSEGLATGYVKGQGLQTLQYANLAAASGGAQGNTPLTGIVNIVSSAGAGYAVTLPVSAPGLAITVCNTSASNTVKVFPNAAGTTTETINALSANAAITMSAATSATFVCGVAGQWYTSPRVPS